MTSFPPHNPADICPKCASPAYRTLYHDALIENGPGLFPEAPGPCWEADGFPTDEKGESLEDEDLATLEHLHRQCPRCGYEAIEALAVTEGEQPTTHRYEVVEGPILGPYDAPPGTRVVGVIGNSGLTRFVLEHL